MVRRDGGRGFYKGIGCGMRIGSEEDCAMNDLDGMLDELAGQAPDPRLEGMETRIAARIARDRRDRGLPLGASLAMIGTALSIGMVSGQATASQAPHGAVALDAGIDLAPSTRLVTAG